VLDRIHELERERRKERNRQRGMYRTRFILTTKFCVTMIILLETRVISPGFNKDGITGRNVAFVHLWFTRDGCDDGWLRQKAKRGKGNQVLEESNLL